jgi:hypothetical protein
MKEKLQNLFSASALLMFFIIALASSDAATSEKEIAESKVPPIIIAPEQLYSDYAANEVAADEKYKDKIVLLTGMVTEIAKDYSGGISITLLTSSYSDGIHCMFSNDHIKETAKLVKGQKVTIKGKCEGLSVGAVMINGCTIVTGTTNNTYAMEVTATEEAPAMEEMPAEMSAVESIKSSICSEYGYVWESVNYDADIYTVISFNDNEFKMAAYTMNGNTNPKEFTRQFDFNGPWESIYYNTIEGTFSDNGKKVRWVFNDDFTSLENDNGVIFNKTTINN